MTIYVTKKKRNTKRRPINNRRTKRRNTKHKYGGMDIKTKKFEKIQNITPQSPKSYEVLKNMIANADELSVISYDSGYGFVFLLKTSNINTKQNEYFIRHSVETPVEKMIIKFGFYADRKSDYFKRNVSTEDEIDEDEEELLKPNQLEFGYTRKYIAQIEYFHEEPNNQVQLFESYPNHEIAFDVACAHLCEKDDRNDLLGMIDSLLKKTTPKSYEKTIINSIIEQLNAHPDIKLGVIAMDYAGNYINEETHTFKTLAELKTSWFSNIVYKKRDYAKQKCYENENAIVISAFMMKGKNKYGNETKELKGFINIDAHEGNYLVNIPKRFIVDDKSNQNKRIRDDPKPSLDDPNEDFRVWAIDTGNVITMGYLDSLHRTYKTNYNTLTDRNYDHDYPFIKWIITNWNINEDNRMDEEPIIPNNMRLFFLHFINTFIISIDFVLSYKDGSDIEHHESPSRHIATYLMDHNYELLDSRYIKAMIDLLNECIPPRALYTMSWTFVFRITDYREVIKKIQEYHQINPVKIHPNIIDKYMRIYEYMKVINPKLPNELISIEREREDDDDDENDNDDKPNKRLKLPSKKGRKE